MFNENNSFPPVSFVSNYLSRKLGAVSGKTCEFPRAKMGMQKVPAPFPNVSSVSGYSDADKAALDEIAREMGDEISALYENAASEEMPFWEDDEIEPVYVLAGMAGEIADKVRAKNAAKIAGIIESPLYSIGMELVSAFGNRKNVLVEMTDIESVELFAVESNLKKGIDIKDLIGRVRYSGMGIVFNAALDNGGFSADVHYSSVAQFASVFDSIIPERVNKVRDDSFRNGKGARSKRKNFGMGNKTAEKAIAAIAKDEDSAVIAEAAKFGYFPLPNYQGKAMSDEDKKVRATMKKRNQRAKKKAMAEMDAKRIEIMEMIDAIAERQTDNQIFSKANKAVTPATALIAPKWETINATIKQRNEKARESAEVFDHEKMMIELDARLKAYARKAKLKAKKEKAGK